MNHKISADRIKIKRAYEAADPSDGTRILVDRLWPRGLTREAAGIDEWPKEITPSTALRKWLHQDPAHWPEFQHRYRAELLEQPEAVERLRSFARDGVITLVYAGRADKPHHAAVLREMLLETT